jgi:hypothetical protein
MRNPIPVTTRIITADSGSSRSPSGTWKSAEPIHVKIVWVTSRSSAGSDTRPRTDITEATNATNIAPEATAATAVFGSRRAPKLLRGNRGTEGAESREASAATLATA